MGESRRKQLAGNNTPDPNWRRKLTSEEIRDIVRGAVGKGIEDINYMWNDMNKTKN